jgi:MerR family transcriptional regulator, copper efflux regulator
MRITEAAQRLGTSPRMLRYRDMLGLLPPVRGTTLATGRTPSGLPRGHRQFDDDDLAAVAHALRIERRYDVSPASLAFGLKVLTEPGVRAEVAELGRRVGRIGPRPAQALEFEKERALRLLHLPPAREPGGREPGGRDPGARDRGARDPGARDPGGPGPAGRLPRPRGE